MGKNRLEAFSDGVLAIILTIMVLEMKVPHGETFEALRSVIPIFFSYILSFLYIGIYWNNHHHLLHACKKVSASVLWANLYLLFWLSLLPFTTGWMGENRFAQTPSVLYGVVLLFAGSGYWLLQHTIIAADGPDSVLRKIVKNNRKGNLSLAFYFVGIIATFWSTAIAQAIYFMIAVAWIVPNPRIERFFNKTNSENPSRF